MGLGPKIQWAWLCLCALGDLLYVTVIAGLRSLKFGAGLLNGCASTAEHSVGAQSWKVMASQCHGADALCLTLKAAVHGSAFHQGYWNRSESFMIFINYYLFCLVFYAPCCLPRRKGCDLICFWHSFGKEDLPWPCQHLSYFAGLFLFHQIYLCFVL